VLIVLALLLICRLLLWFVALAAVSRLARRNGQALKMMSWSFRHGYAAEFFEPKDRRGA
jgi:hypothetical protein